ncbi:MAG: inositol monophosphatase family protein [Leptolyngbyaceae cyanobacterium bins.59]|nr:inositol monophosphatase family protein [Leptolyngbyaceae cyanobacterium bins.59]
MGTNRTNQGEQANGHALEDLLTLARSIGWGAGAILQDFYHNSAPVEVQKAGEAPITAADLAANHYILDNLHAALGTQNFGYLSEETFQTQAPEDRLRHEWVWVIDPLDGTKDFIQRTGEFAVHIALAYQGRPVLAVVSWPEAQKLYYALKGQGTFVEMPDGQGAYTQTRLKVSDRANPEEYAVIVSRTHRDDRFNQLLTRLPFRDRAYVGSVGCKIAAIVDHRADVYLSLSGKSAPKDWDMCAPELILTEAGGQFTHFDNTPLTYNNPDVSQWGGLMATNGCCHGELCEKASAILQEMDQER